MSERIDHASEAEALIENYAPDYMVAQVHATLALVEQQRIANLIQLMHIPTGDLSDGVKEALHAAFPVDRDWEADLRGGLGLS